MSFKEFDVSELKKTMEKYAEEAEKNYGKTKEYKDFDKKTANYTDQNWYRLDTEGTQIFIEFANIMNKGADSNEAQQLVKKWKKFISQNFYECTDSILKNLGEMYVQDERFVKNIDKHGEGLAKFINKEIEIYCK